MNINMIEHKTTDEKASEYQKPIRFNPKWKARMQPNGKEINQYAIIFESITIFVCLSPLNIPESET